MDIKAAKRTECVRGEICAYWLAGRCNRNPCRFLRGEKLSPPMACGNVSSAYPYAKQSHSFAEKIPEYNSKKVLIKKSGGGVTINTRATQKSSSICKYWINGNCIRGDKCWNLHSWFFMEGISTLAKLQGRKKAITGITLLVGLDKLYSSSNDGTFQMWDCNNSTCTDVVTRGAEVRSMICEGLWVCQMLLRLGTFKQLLSLFLMDLVGKSLPWLLPMMHFLLVLRMVLFQYGEAVLKPSLLLNWSHR